MTIAPRNQPSRNKEGKYSTVQKRTEGTAEGDICEQMSPFSSFWLLFKFAYLLPAENGIPPYCATTAWGDHTAICIPYTVQVVKESWGKEQTEQSSQY